MSLASLIVLTHLNCPHLSLVNIHLRLHLVGVFVVCIKRPGIFRVMFSIPGFLIPARLLLTTSLPSPFQIVCLISNRLPLYRLSTSSPSPYRIVSLERQLISCLPTYPLLETILPTLTVASRVVLLSPIPRLPT